MRHIYEINGTMYIVNSFFKENGETFQEKLLRLMIHDLKNQDIDDEQYEE